MSRIKRNYIVDDAINGSKFRLDNNEYLKARNADNSANINILRVGVDNKVYPQNIGTPVSATDGANKAYVDAQLANGPQWEKFVITDTHFEWDDSNTLHTTLMALPAKSYIQGIFFKPTVASTDTANFSIGIDFNYSLLVDGWDITAAISESNSLSTNILHVPKFGATSDITMELKLDEAATSVPSFIIEFYLLKGILP